MAQGGHPQRVLIATANLQLFLHYIVQENLPISRCDKKAWLPLHRAVISRARPSRRGVARLLGAWGCVLAQADESDLVWRGVPIPIQARNSLSSDSDGRMFCA